LGEKGKATGKTIEKVKENSFNKKWKRAGKIVNGFKETANPWSLKGDGNALGLLLPKEGDSRKTELFKELLLTAREKTGRGAGKGGRDQ